MGKQGVDYKFWVGIGISALCMGLLFTKIDPHKVAAAFREMDWRYLVPAVIATFISFFGRAVRWHFLVLPLKKVPLGSLYPATIIGYMANNLLPARLGEFVRAYVLARKEGIDTSAVFATLVVDRLCDGFTVLLMLLFTFFTLHLPPGMETVQQRMVAGGYITLTLYCGVIAFLVLLKRRTSWTLSLVGKLLRPFPAVFSEKLIPLLGSFIGGIRLSTAPRELAAVIASSLFIWAFAAWPVDLLLRSFGIVLPFTGSLFILIFLVFGVMVPASPGYVGTYHIACVTALAAFNIPSEKALSVALVIHGVSFFPVIIAGAYHMWREKISFSSIRTTSPEKELQS
ncbi:flippase-like domain-containing protein [Geobacter pelophilus]|uniref:Flippase-like domain-containing protein n=1 Tax=Geoanaerobacter pelophilus TaxID=60036 RepID=A0AAW4L2X9_9BACT|nr:lysylphosphatidylglycerol synthase transmembrane domain-containing protein [Geoanaerobacter pelophilus]MBT0664562.1 flippase-like domain-containing protein [Geoanaerobacter pelophilus]